MLSTGVCGWMCDFGETLPLDAELKSGADSRSFHTLYTSVWARLNQDAIKKANQTLKPYCSAEDVVFFMRSGNRYSPGISRSFWLGDQLVTWDAHDGLATVVMGMLSEGISGFSHTHSDIGGYTAIDYSHVLKYVRQKELFMRWCELAAFTTMYRTHLGTLPNENWQFNSDNETLQHFFKMAVIFKGLSAYRSTLMNDTYRYGWPVIRHMMLNYPNNSKVYTEDLTAQFMLGDQFIVAPVLENGSTSVHVFLPVGTTWRHIWTGQDNKGTCMCVVL
jgi:alpha-glucosidase